MNRNVSDNTTLEIKGHNCKCDAPYFSRKTLCVVTESVVKKVYWVSMKTLTTQLSKWE